MLPAALLLKSNVGFPPIVVKSIPRGLNAPVIFPMITPSRLTMSISRVLTDTNRLPPYFPQPFGANATCLRPLCPVPSGIVVNSLMLPAGSTV